MSGQHCESYDVKWETVHCYPVNSSLLTAVARDGWNLSAVFKFCFCFVLLYNKSLNDCSPRDQSLSVYYQNKLGDANRQQSPVCFHISIYLLKQNML